MMTKTNDGIKVQGLIRATVSDPLKAPDLYIELIKMRRKGIVDRSLILEFNKRAQVHEYIQNNVVPTVGRTLFAKLLTQNLSALADGIVNYSALGTGSTAPAVGDTVLDTEVYRKLVASLSYTDNIAYLTAFYLATDTNGTYYEHGMFADATGTVDTGTLVSRVLLNAPTGIAKSAAETLTIEHEITFSV